MGRQAGVAATEWSWGALLFDMDNDGLRDIFVSNGIYKDLLDRDYLSYHANEESVRSRIRSKQKNVITELIDAMPSQPVPNAAYRNLGGFRFEDSATEWGLGEDSFSNGSAYGDLDNDGDLDLIVNNVNMPAFVYRNGADTLGSRSIRFELEQSGDNRKAIGSQVTISYGGKKAMAENYVSRGFQSSVSPILHFGVGSAKRVDTVQIRWPDGHIQKLGNLETNRKHHITHPNDPAISTSIKEGALATTPLREIAPLFDFEHRENPYIDFNNERLLTQMYSNEGPAFASADVNGDGRPDFYLGGAKNQSGSLYLSREGTYVPISEPFESDAISEEVQALFFDGDGDGDDDLYICHGGRAFSPHSQALHDAYYRNDEGAFLKIPEALSLPAPMSTGVAAPADYDGDGDLDLFVGERYKPHLYGTSGSGLILQNDGNGNFAALEIPALQNLGMVTDAAWTDIDGDGRPDLVVSGEWMSINIFANTEDGFEDQTERYGLDQTEGLWQSIEIADFDGDGDDDILAGNIGRNNFFEPGTRMYIADFDGNGFAEQITCLQRNGKYYPIIDKDELIAQIPSLKKKLLFYSDYAKSDMASLFDAATLEQAEILDLNLLESTVFLRAENGFQASPLPQEIQYAPVYDTTRYDINGDGFPDIFLGGNQYLVKPQFGRYDASMGWVIFGPLDPNTDAKVSPLSIEGQIRHMEWVESDKGAILVVSLNNGKTRFYE